MPRPRAHALPVALIGGLLLLTGCSSSASPTASTSSAPSAESKTEVPEVTTSEETASAHQFPADAKEALQQNKWWGGISTFGEPNSRGWLTIFVNQDSWQHGGDSQGNVLASLHGNIYFENNCLGKPLGNSQDGRASLFISGSDITLRYDTQTGTTLVFTGTYVGGAISVATDRGLSVELQSIPDGAHNEWI